MSLKKVISLQEVLQKRHPYDRSRSMMRISILLLKKVHPVCPVEEATI
jgi:hypothetical protein